MRRQRGARAVVAGALAGLAALAGTAGQYFQEPSPAVRVPWGAAGAGEAEQRAAAAAGECSMESWVTIIEERLGDRVANGLYNASVRSLWGPLGFDRGDDTWWEIASRNSTWRGATWFLPTDAALEAYAAAQNFTAAELAGPKAAGVESVEDRFRAAKLGALAFWHSGCPGDLPAGSCPFVLADGGDKVRGPAGCGEARIVAGPVTDCAYGTTYFSVDRVLPLSECQEGMPAIRQAALDRMDDYWGDYAYMEDYLDNLADYRDYYLLDYIDYSTDYDVWGDDEDDGGYDDGYVQGEETAVSRVEKLAMDHHVVHQHRAEEAHTDPPRAV